MAADAARLAVEQRQAALCSGRERLVVAAGKAVKRRVQKDQSALEAGNGPAEIVIVGGAAVRLLEQTLVCRSEIDGSHGTGRIRMPHLDGIEDRQLGLILERGRTPVPELSLQHCGVHGRRRTAFAEMIADPFRYAAVVGE